MPDGRCQPRLTYAIGSAFPDYKDFTAELFGDGAQAGFICDERAVLLRASRDVDGCAARTVCSINPRSTLSSELATPHASHLRRACSSS